VDDAQESEMVEVVVPVTESEPGMVGVVESTVTVVVAVLVPFAFVAVKVYVIVEVGFTMNDPTSVLVLNEPGVMATDDAFVTLKERVEVPAGATTLEEAVKEEMEGRVTVFSEPIAQKVLGLLSLRYSVANQAADRVILEIRNSSSRVPLDKGTVPPC
jgi:hypothetical protein